jgi:hypothetical protein
LGCRLFIVFNISSSVILVWSKHNKILSTYVIVSYVISLKHMFHSVEEIFLLLYLEQGIS